MEFTISEIMQGAGLFFGAFGVSIYGLKKNGKITFGRPKERRNCAGLCSEHTGLVHAIDRNAMLIEESGKKLDGVDSKVDRVLGHLGKL